VKETKILLNEKEIPTQWYNIQADLGFDLPPLLHPATLEPTILPPPLFPRAMNDDEFSKERYIEIPEPVRDAYRLWRPSPMYRARRWEKALDTPAKIYYKYEGGSPPGSHKPNTAVAQAFYSKGEGIKRLATETGAGQWGSALAFACQLFDLELKVYMVKISYNQKPYRRILMETWGAEVVASPSPDTPVGQHILANDPDNLGSLGIAISEAVADAGPRDDTHYSIGSVINSVLLHQTVIGQEAKNRRFLPAIPQGQAGWQQSRPAGRLRRVHGLPQPQQGPLRLRLGRHGQGSPYSHDVHPGPHLHSRPHPRRWAALPWHGPHHLCPLQQGDHRSRGRLSESCLRGGSELRPH